MPFEDQPTSTKGKGKQREFADVEIASEPDEAADPLRSRSPRPYSPRLYNDDNASDGSGHGKEKGRVRPSDLQSAPQTGEANPFESKLDHPRFSPPTEISTHPLGPLGDANEEGYEYLPMGASVDEGDHAR
jgi:hypothetical protein